MQDDEYYYSIKVIVAINNPRCIHQESSISFKHSLKRYENHYQKKTPEEV